MQLQQEKLAINAIESYNSNSVTINKTTYTKTIYIDANKILQIECLVSLSSIHNLDPELLLQQISTTPEILLIGQVKPVFLRPEQQAYFLQRRIGVECMSLDAACRTFNILVSEERNVGLLLCFP